MRFVCSKCGDDGVRQAYFNSEKKLLCAPCMVEHLTAEVTFLESELRLYKEAFLSERGRNVNLTSRQEQE